ncbi:MAG: NAD-dependent epimerase/dehydratase family protein [Planctomycetaceae bacterium]
MTFDENDLLLVTGATGLVGSHVAETARQRNIRTRALVRATSDKSLLQQWGVETVDGDMSDAESLKRAVENATVIVHCAAKVGDWGPVESYRAVNVEGVENLLTAAEATGVLKRYVHISSLGVYEARDHHGTDESEEPNTQGIDGYTLTKVESEQVVLRHIQEKQLPGTVLRPGFIYGPRDRTVLPRLLEKLKAGKVKFLGSGEQLMNNTYVGNLVDAIFATLEHDESIGGVYNITDNRLVSKREFMKTVAEQAGYPVPTKSVPLGFAKFLAKVLEGLWKLLGKTEAPILSKARIKFLGLNLDFCIDKAKRELGYDPKVDFTEGMQRTIDWFQQDN